MNNRDYLSKEVNKTDEEIFVGETIRHGNTEGPLKETGSTRKKARFS